MQIELLTCGGIRRCRSAAPVPSSFPAQPCFWRWKDPASSVSADSQSSLSLRLPVTGLTTADIMQWLSVNLADVAASTFRYGCRSSDQQAAWWP